MRKLLSVIFVLLLAGCSANQSDLTIDEQAEVSDQAVFDTEVDQSFELIEDTVEYDSELAVYEGLKRFEGEEELIGQLKYPSAFDTPWYFVAYKVESLDEDFSFLLDASEDLAKRLPNEIMPECTYEFEAVVRIKNPVLIYSANHLYTDVDSYSILSVSDDFVETCN